MKEKSSSTTFVKSMSALVSGTVVGQLITALTLPILTRIYSPEDFAMLAAFNAITSLVAIVACLRYDIAIPFAEKEKEARILVATSFIFAMMCVILVIIILSIIPSEWIISTLGNFSGKAYIWLIPLAILSLASFSIVQNWYTRLKKFKFIAGIRVLQASSASGAQLIMGLSGLGPLGLILGYLFNSIVGAFLMGVTMLRNKITHGIKISEFSGVAKNNKKFPMYSTWEALFNSGAIQLPILMIASFGIGPEAGYLAISMYMLQVPMVLVGNSVGQIYYSEAPKAYREGLLSDFNILMLKRLSTLGTGPLIFAGIISPSIFVWIFGAEWERAGQMVRFMTPWFILQFMTSPLSLAFTTIGRQKLGSQLQASGLLVRTGAVTAAAFLFPEFIVEVFALSGAIFYGYYLIALFRVVKTPWLSVLKAFIGNFWVTFIWLIFGVVVLLSFPFFKELLI